MFDIERELNEVRSIDVSPSRKLIDTTTRMVKTKSSEYKDSRRKTRRSNIIKLSGFAALPAAASVLLAVVIGLVTPQAAAYYTVDIGQSIVMSVDESGYVIDVDQELDFLDESEIKDESIEYAVSQAIAYAQQDGYIDEGEPILIGCFGDDIYNNISKNQVLSYLGDTALEINLLSVHGTMEDWDSAQAIDISAGLYKLALLSDIDVNSDIELNALILATEDATGMSIAMLLNENTEPINYTAPNLNYYIENNHINIHWDYIDYKSINYDGDITYRLISFDTTEGLVNNPEVLDLYTFASWDKQPVDYTLPYDEKHINKYYAIAAVYDDKTIVLIDEYIYVP